eukprot:8922649-Pyramimonas_sp.AAC.1
MHLHLYDGTSGRRQEARWGPVWAPPGLVSEWPARCNPFSLKRRVPRLVITSAPSALHAAT